MKFFLLLALVFVAVWLFRGSRRRDLPGAPPSGKAEAKTSPTGESIVACVHCGLHLPRSEAVSDEAGIRSSRKRIADHTMSRLVSMASGTFQFQPT